MRRFSGVLIVALLAGGVAGTASADPIGPGTQIILTDSYGTTGGGEFAGQIVGTGPAIDFISFCLETNEYFTPGQILKVDGVSNEARMGGSGGGSGGADPLDRETAWLFTQFSQQTLGGYDYDNSEGDRADSADALQRAIWFLEQERPNVEGDVLAQQWIDAAKLAVAAGWSSTGNVVVLNLLRKDSAGNFTLKAQDQLYYRSVPEPGSLFLLSTGLFALAASGSRARRKVSA